MKKIIIQGVKGSFHDIAARNFFSGEPLELVPAKSFTELFSVFSQDQSIDHAVMAIENTIAGSIMYNYHLLMDSDFLVTGELFLRIKQNLLISKNADLSSIREVHSHPMAIAQCRSYLSGFSNWKLIEREDTALCAQEIGLNKSNEIAAIASELAAEVYDLKVAKPGIETNKRNFTRFLVLSRKDQNLLGHSEKTSIRFSLKHETGSLNEILTQLSNHQCNLTKIQSVPIIGKEWQYYFFVDFILNRNSFNQVINDLEGKVESLKILGNYQKGINHDS